MIVVVSLAFLLMGCAGNSDGTEAGGADLELDAAQTTDASADHELIEVALSLEEVVELTGIEAWDGPILGVIDPVMSDPESVECGVPAPSFAEQLTVDFVDAVSQTAVYTLASVEGENAEHILDSIGALVGCETDAQEFELLNIDVAGADSSLVLDVSGVEATAAVTFVFANFDGNLLGTYALNGDQITVDAATAADITAAMGAKLS